MAPPIAFASPLSYYRNIEGRWPGGRVTYYLDPAGFRGLPEAQLRTELNNALDKWRNVRTAEINASVENLTSNIATFAQFELAQADNPRGVIVVFDDKGDVVRGFYNAVNKEAPGQMAPPETDANNNFVRAYLFLDERKAAEWGYSLEQILIHEVGHSLGLDHSQAKLAEARDSVIANDIYVPIMFPTPLNAHLSPDDEAWISRIYPRADAFLATYGYIVGFAVDGKDRGVPGIHVRAVRTAANAKDEKGITAASPEFSFPTGTYERRPGDFQLSGLFVLPVPPGRYALFVESFSREFVDDRSAPGKYARDGIAPRIVGRFVRMIDVPEKGDRRGHAGRIVVALEVPR